ncbi:MAG: 2Fe-2S iron-sulfur cluster-binding protein [Pyrinomonadaceae bacterium]
MTKFETYLNGYDEATWTSALERLLFEIHEVDRIATQVWFRFYPLALHQYLESAEDKEKTIGRFVMQGDYELNDQIDSSHSFLYGHRFWKEVKAEIEKRAESFENEDPDLADEIRTIAKDVAGKAKKDVSLLIGITAVGLMTLVQTGLEAFKNASGETEKPSGVIKNSPEKIVEMRKTDDSQGLLGFLKTVNKEYTVVYDETQKGAKFRIFSEEEIASASARDQSQNWRERDERCIEGVIPVECRSASCGTCWVGILGGAEKLSEVAPLERKRMRVFGYGQDEDEKPFMRLACQAKAYGNVHLVIPPWNGVFGKKVYGNVERVELEPATTSAAKLREMIESATSEK